MSRSKLLIIVSCIWFLSGCSNPSQGSGEKIELTISAAASLKDALMEIEKIYEEQNKEIDLSFNFASSGTLSKQIEQGAPVDLFLSANLQDFTDLVDKKLIEEERAIQLLENELVLITSLKSSVNSIKQITALDKLAIGIPEIVPAGEYAKEALIHLNLWENVQENIVLAKDVRQVLSYVETGNVEGGIVYKTDANSSGKIKEVWRFDSSLHSPIIYPVGVIESSHYKKEAIKLQQFLQKENAIDIFERHGFNVVNEEEK